MGEAIEQLGNHVLLHVHAVPRASRTQVAGLHGERVKIQVAAPPVDGEANETLVRFLARLLGIPRDRVVLATGASGRQKSFLLHDTTVEVVRAGLELEP
jgi:uncharacterized protein (TIGR00251 family)